MTTIKDLEEQIAELSSMVTAQSEVIARQDSLLKEIMDQPVEEPEIGKRADYMAHGSKEHAAFMGLIIMTEDESKRAKSDGLQVFQSPDTERWYRLEDPITPFMHAADPQQIAYLTLRQCVSTLESGVPPIPEYAPPLWRPPNSDY